MSLFYFALFGGESELRSYMKRYKVYLVLLSLFVLLLSLTGCGKKEAENTPVSKTAYPVTITGSDGSEIVLESEPMKIVSVSPSITEIIYSLGMSEKLLAVSDYCNYPEEVLNIQSIGTLFAPDFEKIIELEPDLIIVSAHLSENSLAMLHSLGIKVLVLYEENDFKGVYTMFETLGTALNVSEKAESIIKDMKEEVQNILDKVKDEQRKTVYYVVSFGEWGDYTAGSDTYIHSLLSLAGADNIAENITGWTYSLEKIIEADPEYIIIGEYAYEEFIHTEPYSSLSAVVNGNVISVNNDKLDRQSCRNVEAVREIAEKLYSEAFK